MNHYLEGDAALYYERLAGLALDLFRMDRLDEHQQLMTMGALSVLDSAALVTVLAASKAMAYLMLKLVLQVESGARP